MGFRFPDPASAWTADEARTIFEAWQQSGESLAAFARRHHVSAARLYWWKRRIAEVPMPGPSGSVAFAAASIVGAEPMVTVRLPGEITIEVAHATPSWLAAVVAELMRSR
jgi:transposase-like protein